ncbi:alpha-galactosidase [Amycolatopsis xylanica]|uniref:Alpha-galactosidase n=1 Tax=Amycolatopsis xylanica TaxID=589385 RepID=A0A1H2T2K0_9PSEU|nr:NPCBM/NEW2 domain-containing protein [Amycolatopsis xylanica]SDW38062.1 alpha-galactosidase [Amycolatopsis xylanica]
MRRLLAFLVAMSAFTIVPAAEASGQLASPPMGWNSWNAFHCDINEQKIRTAADVLVSSGMRDAGYEYVNIDDCWAEPQRNVMGDLEANRKTFPSGMKALADYVHAKGLKLGIYTSAGTRTCADTMPGGLDHEAVDARTFAAWGVDYLKYDNCNTQGRPASERYQAMGDALKATGRDIVYALCEWGENKPWLWGRTVGAQLWRTTLDIADSWDSMTDILDKQIGLEAYSGPGGWNDPDMLEVGNGGMTDTEYRAHFALWSILNAPLIAGNDLGAMTPETRKILLNRDLIAVNQDWGGKQGHKIRDDGDTEVWAKPMSDGSAAVLLLNRASATRTVSAEASALGLRARDYRVRDLWTGAETSSAGVVRASVPGHGASVFRVWPSRGVLAPHTTLSLDAPELSGKGEPLKTTVTLFNDGTTPVAAVRVRFAVPAGWTTDGSTEASVPVVLPGKSWQRTFTVKPSAQVAATVSPSVSAEYWSVGGRGTLTTTTATTLATAPPAGTTSLSTVDWVSASNGWGPVERNMSNGEQAQGDGHRMRIGTAGYDDGLGVHASSHVRFYLGGKCRTLTSLVGVDLEANGGSVKFEVIGDGKSLAASDVVRFREEARPLQADVTGVRALDLVVTDGGDGSTSDHGDWANLKVAC